LGLNRYFRAGQSHHALTFSTQPDASYRRNEPKVFVHLRPENELVIGYSTMSPSRQLEYLLPFDQGFPTFRRFLHQLWTNTMPEGIPADLRGPIAPLVAPILTHSRTPRGLIG
jgi:hypothetical protein